MTKSTIAKILGAIAIIALVVGAFHLFHKSNGGQIAVSGGVNPGGGDVIQSVNTFVPGVVIGAKFQQWVALSLPLGTNQSSWCNTTGQTAYASGGRFTLASTTPNGNVSASTTLALSVATSTKASVTDSKTVYGGLVNQVLIATSSTAFDAKSILVLGGWSSSPGTAGAASSTIPVANGECLVAALENPYQTVGDTNGYSATSSGRGYVLNGIFEYSF